MSSNLEIDYDRLKRFLSLAVRDMSEQAARLGGSLENVLFELANNITPDQAKRLQDNIRRSRFLMKEIMNYGTVYKTALDFFHQPTQLDWQEANVRSVIEQAIESAQSFVGDFSQFGTIDTTIEEEVFVYSVYPLLVRTISSLIIWAHLLAPSSQILITFAQTETEITLKVLGYTPSSGPVDSIDEQVCSLSRELAELIVPTLGGSFSWKSGQIIPDEDELVIHLPKSPLGNSPFGFTKNDPHF